jgi:hypothetical protein
VNRFFIRPEKGQKQEAPRVRNKSPLVNKPLQAPFQAGLAKAGIAFAKA